MPVKLKRSVSFTYEQVEELLINKAQELLGKNYNDNYGKIEIYWDGDEPTLEFNCDVEFTPICKT